MIQWRKELWNVECEGTRGSSFWLTQTNDMCESNTSVQSGFEFESTKLARVKKVVGGNYKLDSLSNCFFNQFTESV